MKRLLCMLSGMNAGGAETFLMKIYRRLDKSKYQMDFCINTVDKCFYEDEITALGGRIYRIPAKSVSVSQFKKQLYHVVKTNEYKYVLRITANAAGFMDLKIAHRAGAEICAVRSSNSSDGGSVWVKLAHRFGRILYGRYVNVRIAPSDLAAKYTFGGKAYASGAVNILHNAIDTDTYGYDAQGRTAVRAEFGISDDTQVLGHVGRFMPQKNHSFLLDVFAAYIKSNPDSVLMLVGCGELELQIKKKAEDLGVLDKLIFTGVRSDVPALLSAMDVFVFPSLYEGMPNTVIEAQATGLSCVIADTITREANITGLVHFLPLRDAAEWADYIAALPQEARTNPVEAFKANGYDIETAADRFVKLAFGE